MKTVFIDEVKGYKFIIKETQSGNFCTSCMKDEQVSILFPQKAFKTLNGAKAYGEKYLFESVT